MSSTFLISAQIHHQILAYNSPIDHSPILVTFPSSRCCWPSPSWPVSQPRPRLGPGVTPAPAPAPAPDCFKIIFLCWLNFTFNHEIFNFFAILFHVFKAIYPAIVLHGLKLLIFSNPLSTEIKKSCLRHQSKSLKFFMEIFYLLGI